MLHDVELTEEVTAALGNAVIDCWGKLPPTVQQLLFEGAAGTHAGDGFRCALALYLHEHHPRTTH